MKKLLWIRFALLLAIVVLAFGCSAPLGPSGDPVVDAGIFGAKKPGKTKPPAPPIEPVKNVILFIGDGMSEAHLQLARFCSIEDLAVDTLDGNQVEVSTVNMDGDVTDSAAGGTAIATGYKTANDWVSMLPDGHPSGLTTPKTVLERAERVGKSTGLITDLVISDATPAVFAAHVEDRDFEEEIIRQMVEEIDIEVLFSGGTSDTYRLRDKVLGSDGEYVGDLAEFEVFYNGGSLDDVDMIYGFFSHNEMAYTLDRENEDVLETEPTLDHLTDVALRVLDNDKNGFFLMVEGGSNDWGGHARDAAWVVAEMKEFNDAVQVAMDWAEGRDDTLIVVTADHECGGLVYPTSPDTSVITAMQATTEWMWGVISHGADIVETVENYAMIFDLSSTEHDLIAANKEMGIADVLSARENVFWGWDGSDEGDHTAIPVPVYAWGPGAEAFDDVSDNTHTGQLLAYAVSGEWGD